MAQSPQTLEGWHARFEAYWAEAPGGDLDAAHDLNHLRRVWRSAQSIARAEAREGGAVDLTVLLAATYFHDLVNPPKNSPLRAQASALSGREAKPLLAGMGFPQDRLDAVAHAIEAHSYSAGVEPVTAEARVLQDADRLEALGAIGLARCFYTGGKMGTSLWHPDDPMGKGDRVKDDARFSTDHFQMKLLRLPGMMRTREGRRMAERRARVLKLFLKELEAELG
ncbi:MAG: HD domain-containing protein [Holophaga sp.]|nr:HD domain-containing protein [Holophaga sp.]